MLLETLIYDEETKMFWNIQRGGPWGGSGGNGGGQGPWGGGGSSGNQPPDIEEMLRRSQDKFKKFIPSGKGGPRRIILLILVAAVIWLGTGFYRVQPSEQGVELLFGKFVKTTTPGLNYWFPAPVGQVFRPDVTNTTSQVWDFVKLGRILLETRV